MRCPNDNDLARWRDGAVSSKEARRIERHLDECLECRMVVGVAATDEESVVSDGSARPPSFDELLPDLRAAFRVAGHGPVPSAFSERAREDLPIVMAADSETQAQAAGIPALHCEYGQTVVTFRAASESGVTAFFVSADPDRARFRILAVGEILFVSDAEGRAPLTGMTAEDVLGRRLAVPPVIGHADIDLADAELASGRSLALVGPGAAPTPWRIEVKRESATALRIHAAELPEGSLDLVVVVGGAARILSWNARSDLICALDDATSGRARFVVFARP